MPFSASENVRMLGRLAAYPQRHGGDAPRSRKMIHPAVLDPGSQRIAVCPTFELAINLDSAAFAFNVIVLMTHD